MTPAPAGTGRSRWPLAAALLLLGVTVAALVRAVEQRTGGPLVYGLDDSYIHMAMAKNVARHGVWGVTQHAFSSSSSSPLWVLLLAAAYGLSGVSAWAPLALNALAAALLVALLFRVLSESAARPPDVQVFVALLATLFAVGVPALVLTGMEHTLQLLLVLAFAHRAALLVAAGEGGDARLWPAVLLAALAAAVRYESLGLVAAAAALLALQRRWGPAAAVLAGGCAPPLLMGLFATAHGGLWLPNPVTIKAHIPNLGSAAEAARFGLGFFEKLFQASEIVLLLTLLLVLLAVELAGGGPPWTCRRAFLLLALAGLCLQTLFSFVGAAGHNMFFYRYEAYVVALGATAVWLQVFGHLPRLLAGRGRAAAAQRVVLVCGLVVGLRAFGANGGYAALTPQAAANVHEQQYQMGLFVRDHYPGGTVVLNDIGAVTFLADARLVDLVGLGSDEVARLGARTARGYGARFSFGRLTLEEIGEVSRDADLAILYDDWFPGGLLPPGWVKVGEWEITGNVACNAPVVSFFAPDAPRAATLLAKLERHAARLPRAVAQRYLAPPS